MAYRGLEYDTATKKFGKLSGAPNDGFLLNTLKTLFRLSRVVLDL